MSLTTLSIKAQIYTNEREPIDGEWCAEDGLIECERTDDNEIAVHLRHVLCEGANLSAYTDRAGAVALAYALLDAARKNKYGGNG